MMSKWRDAPDRRGRLRGETDGPLTGESVSFMSVEYPTDHPRTREERMKALMAIRDEDIDLSDMPELREEDMARATRRRR